MAAFNKFNDFSEQDAKGVHAFGTHTYKIALTNSAPTATMAALSEITQITAANGYPAGGTAIASMAVSETGGVATITGNSVIFTASGGSIGPFRYAVMYNDTATSPADALVGWHDYGSAITLADTETFEWKPSNLSTGGTILTKTVS